MKILKENWGTPPETLRIGVMKLPYYSMENRGDKGFSIKNRFDKEIISDREQLVFALSSGETIPVKALRNEVPFSAINFSWHIVFRRFCLSQQSPHNWGGCCGR